MVLLEGGPGLRVSQHSTDIQELFLQNSPIANGLLASPMTPKRREVGDKEAKKKKEKPHLVALQRGLAADSGSSCQALAAAAAPHSPKMGTEGLLF